VTTNDSPDFSQGAWQTFSADHDPNKAIAAFEKRYGRLPQYVALDTRFRVATLKAGPVPAPEEDLL
jgi:hypothetical protein